MEKYPNNKNAIFCNHGTKSWRLTDLGSLAGCKLAVKDLFAIAGEKNGAGNPDWLAKAAAATETASSVQKLMAQGAEFVGFTHTDELAYSLEGNNLHYGAAENPSLPGHACGGSSMGSAAAVAANLADIGLGTDTGGSIRVPASYCGLYGIRPSHGVIESNGLIGLAPNFDTIGWFTRSAELLATTGDALLPKQPVNTVDELLVCDALFDLVEPSLAELLKTELSLVSKCFKRVTHISLDQRLLNKLADTFRVLQGRSIAETHRQWIEEQQPVFAPAIAQRFNMALALTAQEQHAAESTQQAFKTELSEHLTATSALFLPTTPCIAPKLAEDTSELRMKILTLTAIAGLTGSAQVHLPHLSVPSFNEVLNKEIHAPYGYSLLMASGQDRSLLSLAAKLAKS